MKWKINRKKSPSTNTTTSVYISVYCQGSAHLQTSIDTIVKGLTRLEPH